MLVDPTGALLTANKPAEVEYTLTSDDIRRLTALEAICQKFGLVVVCPECTRIFGPGKDGVTGDNDPQSRAIELRCGHLRRVYRP